LKLYTRADLAIRTGRVPAASQLRMRAPHNTVHTVTQHSHILSSRQGQQRRTGMMHMMDARPVPLTASTLSGGEASPARVKCSTAREDRLPEWKWSSMEHGRRMGPLVASPRSGRGGRTWPWLDRESREDSADSRLRSRAWAKRALCTQGGGVEDGPSGPVSRG